MALATLLTLVGCGRVDPSPGIESAAVRPYGLVQGIVSISPAPTGASAPTGADATAASTVGTPLPRRAQADTAGEASAELLVAFALDRPAAPPPQRLDTEVGTAVRIRELALPGVALYRVEHADGGVRDSVMAELVGRPGIRYVQANARRLPLASANDPLLAQQWALPALRVPEAWDLETGDAGTTVAVLDTGILVRPETPSDTHPDFIGRTVSGYDFVSDPARSNDGDGRDPDPYDDGDALAGPSSYHGTHVASSIGAATDNGVGMSGVDWRAGLLAVRVLGVDGGTVADVVDGLMWAIGAPVPGVPTNARPADVLNLSLGGAGACSPAEQAALDAARAAGAVVVVAAGNEAGDVAGTAPANCRSVVVASATDALGRRAPYANLGAAVDVMAPGGDLGADADADGYPDGILGASRNDATGAFDYVRYQGTSMAAAHVSGVAALLRAHHPALTPDQVETVLERTARPLDAAACDGGRLGPAACGAGLVDARAALAGAVDVEPPQGTLSIDPAQAAFGSRAASVPLTLSNVGSADLSWSYQGFRPLAGNPAPVPAAALSIARGAPASGTLRPGESVGTLLVLDRALLSVPGSYALSALFASDGEEVELPCTFTQPATELTGTLRVIAWQEGAIGQRRLTGMQELSEGNGAFEMIVLAGETWLFAWLDHDDDGIIDAGDAYAALDAPIGVAPGSTTSGVTLVLGPVEASSIGPTAVP